MEKEKKKKATYTLPDFITQDNFSNYILPYLTVGSRGPKPYMESHTIVNAIFKVLSSGGSWKILDGFELDGVKLKSSTIYYHYVQWVNDGCFQTMFEETLKVFLCNNMRDTLIIDSTYIRGFKNQELVDYYGSKKMNCTKFHSLTTEDNIIAKPFCFEMGNNSDYENIHLYQETLTSMRDGFGEEAYLLADAGYDSKEMKDACYAAWFTPVININNRNSKIKRQLEEPEATIYKKRRRIESTFSWMKKYKGIRMRIDRKLTHWMSKVYFAAFLVNMRLLFV